MLLMFRLSAALKFVDFKADGTVFFLEGKATNFNNSLCGIELDISVDISGM